MRNAALRHNEPRNPEVLPSPIIGLLDCNRGRWLRGPATIRIGWYYPFVLI
jgi:hypothetical protein